MGILPSTSEKPESHCPIASLSLETFGKTLSTDDIEVLRHEVEHFTLPCKMLSDHLPVREFLTH